jgi:hypothetical protein
MSVVEVTAEPVPEVEDASDSGSGVEDAAVSGPEADGGAGDGDSTGLVVAYGAAEGLEVVTLTSDAEPVAASSARAASAGAAFEASRGVEGWGPAVASVGAGADASLEANGTSVEAPGALVAGADASVATDAEASNSAPELAEMSRSPFPGFEPAEPAATVDPSSPTDGPEPPGWAVGGASGADRGGNWSPTPPGWPATSGRGVTRTRAGVPM